MTALPPGKGQRKRMVPSYRIQMIHTRGAKYGKKVLYPHLSPYRQLDRVKFRHWPIIAIRAAMGDGQTRRKYHLRAALV
jgi:hypothetical protein